MKKLHVGCLIVCIKCETIPLVVGHVGEITGRNASFGWSQRGPWICQFPALRTMMCPDCHTPHTVKEWYMDNDEIKPIEDPDDQISFIKTEELEEIK